MGMRVSLVRLDTVSPPLDVEVSPWMTRRLNNLRSISLSHAGGQAAALPMQGMLSQQILSTRRQGGRSSHTLWPVCAVEPAVRFNQKIFAIWWKNTFQLSSFPVGPLSNTFGKTVQFWEWICEQCSSTIYSTVAKQSSWDLMWPLSPTHFPCLTHSSLSHYRPTHHMTPITITANITTNFTIKILIVMYHMIPMTTRMVMFQCHISFLQERVKYNFQIRNGLAAWHSVQKMGLKGNTMDTKDQKGTQRVFSSWRRDFTTLQIKPGLVAPVLERLSRYTAVKIDNHRTTL